MGGGGGADKHYRESDIQTHRGRREGGGRKDILNKIARIKSSDQRKREKR